MTAALTTAVYLEAFYQAARAKGWTEATRRAWFTEMHRVLGMPFPAAG
jgi:hypothetical protein